MSQLKIAGDRLLLALDFIEFLDRMYGETDQTFLSGLTANPRRFSVERCRSALTDSLRVPLEDLHGSSKNPLERPHVYLCSLRLFLHSNRMLDHLEFDVYGVLSNLLGWFRPSLIRILQAFASDEITEEMLREPAETTM